MSDVQRYRKKPVEIDAIQITDDISIAAAYGWMSAYGTTPSVHGEVRPFGLLIRTLEGDMIASPGDYVIRGIQGEFYPCKPDIFEASYDVVPA